MGTYILAQTNFIFIMIRNRKWIFDEWSVKCTKIVATFIIYVFTIFNKG